MSSLGVILVIVFLVLAMGGLPNWNFHRYGYAPSGVLTLVLVIVLVLALMGRL